MSILLLGSLIGAGLVAVSVFIVGIVRVVKLHKRLKNEEHDRDQAQIY